MLDPFEEQSLNLAVYGSSMRGLKRAKSCRYVKHSVVEYGRYSNDFPDY